MTCENDIAVILIGRCANYFPKTSPSLPVFERLAEETIDGSSPNHSIRDKSFAPRLGIWACNAKPLEEPGATGLVSSLPRDNCQIFIFIPSQPLSELNADYRRSTWDVANAVSKLYSSRAASVKISLVFNETIESIDVSEWAVLFNARDVISRTLASAIFFSRSMVRPSSCKNSRQSLWSGALHIPGHKPYQRNQIPLVSNQVASDRILPGFELVLPPTMTLISSQRIDKCITSSSRNLKSTYAIVLAVVPPAAPIGGFLNSKKELEMHLTKDCNPASGFFCRSWFESGASLLIRIEQLTMLCFWRTGTKNSTHEWVCDVAPIFDIDDATAAALDCQWFRKYELGQCSRSKVYCPPDSVASLPVVPFTPFSGSCDVSQMPEPERKKWINPEEFKQAVAVVSRTNAKLALAPATNPLNENGLTAPSFVLPRLREPPALDEISRFERDILQHDSVLREESAKKRARSGNHTQGSYCETPVPPGWTGRTSLTGEVITPHGVSSTNDMDYLRKHRRNRLLHLNSNKRPSNQQNKVTQAPSSRRDTHFKVSSSLKALNARSNSFGDRFSDRRTVSSSVLSRAQSYYIRASRSQDSLPETSPTLDALTWQLNCSSNYFEGPEQNLSCPNNCDATVCFKTRTPKFLFCNHSSSGEMPENVLENRCLKCGCVFPLPKCCQGSRPHGIEYKIDNKNPWDSTLAKYECELGRTKKEYSSLFEERFDDLRRVEKLTRSISALGTASSALEEEKESASCLSFLDSIAKEKSCSGVTQVKSDNEFKSQTPADLPVEKKSSFTPSNGNLPPSNYERLTQTDDMRELRILIRERESLDKKRKLLQEKIEKIESRMKKRKKGNIVRRSLALEITDGTVQECTI